MPLFNITWEGGNTREVKEAIRNDISRDMGRLAGINPGFIAVLFTDLPIGNMSMHGSFTEVYISEGRPPEFKNAVVELITNAITKHTGWEKEKVNEMIHDFRKGSIAVGGRIVNRSGPAAEAVIEEKG